MRFKTLAVTMSLLLAIAANTPNLIAQESATDSNADTARQTQDLGSDLITKIQGAINGDEPSRQALVNEFFVPAAMALILLIVGYLFASFLGRVIGNMVSSRVDKTIGRFTGRVVQNAILTLVVLGALGYFGVDVTSFAAILAATGFAVGMALQGTLSNFAAGVMLLVFRPFQIDDYIKVGDTEGTVEEIDLFTTKINTADNLHVIVPNGNIFGETMANYSRNSLRRVEVNVGAAYDAEIATTRSVLESAIHQIEGAVHSPSPQVYLVELGDSSVNWQCRVWAAPKDYWAVRERTTEAVKVALDNAGVAIPFPQMDINVAGKLFAKAA